ncbi:Uncharacterised protein [Vibrio cholerae]|nr:Uncharacterised protein [Vibrio cholerae]
MRGKQHFGAKADFFYPKTFHRVTTLFRHRDMVGQNKTRVRANLNITNGIAFFIHHVQRMMLRQLTE